MCRHLGWLGAPRTLAALVLEPANGLLRQSFAPRRQAHGRVNADGWGVGFWAGPATAGAASAPARWRSARPLWQDANLASVGRVVSAGCVVAAVRSATAGMPLDEAATAPFTDGRWLLSHNGRVDRGVLPLLPAAEVESVCDSAQLAALVFADGPERLGRTVTEVGARDPAARLNVLVADGRQLLATTWGDTLSVLELDDGVAVASEPWDDDPRWRDIPDRSLLTASAAAGVHISSLETA